MTNAKKRERLLKARRLLQRAHDYIETHGFDIDTYGEDDANGPRCYIGSLRTVANLNPEPSDDGKADGGNGPELTYAFKVLDRLVTKDLSAYRLGKADGRIGRAVEQYGFQLQSDSLLTLEEQTNHALMIFRRALTKIHNKLEALERSA